MKKNKIILLLAMCILAIATGFAQSKKKPTNKKKVPAKNSDVQVFDESNSDDIFDEKSTVNVYNTLKINALGLLGGDVPIYYERVLSPHVSVEAGLGITLPSLRAGNVFKSAGLFGFNYGENVVLDKANSSPFLSASLRYFPSKGKTDIPEGVYFSLGTLWRKYSFNSHLDNESIPFFPQKSITKHFEYVNLKIGVAKINDRFITDYYVGFALRNTTKSSYFYDSNNNFEITPYSVNSVAPAIVLGHRLGFGF